MVIEKFSLTDLAGNPAKVSVIENNIRRHLIEDSDVDTHSRVYLALEEHGCPSPELSNIIENLVEQGRLKRGLYQVMAEEATVKDPFVWRPGSQSAVFYDAVVAGGDAGVTVGELIAKSKSGELKVSEARIHALVAEYRRGLYGCRTDEKSGAWCSQTLVSVDGKKGPDERIRIVESRGTGAPPAEVTALQYVPKKRSKKPDAPAAPAEGTPPPPPPA